MRGGKCVCRAPVSERLGLNSAHDYPGPAAACIRTCPGAASTELESILMRVNYSGFFSSVFVGSTMTQRNATYRRAG